MYNTNEQQNRDTKKYTAAESEIKLGKVTEVTAQHLPKVQINGSGTGSTKVYPCLTSYYPHVGDVVMLVKQGLTYVVVGAIEDEVLTTVWALAEHTHSGYAAANHTHSEYAATNHTHSEYAASTHIHSSLTDKSGSTTYGSISFNRSSGSIAYYQISSSSAGDKSASVKYGLIPGTSGQMLGWGSNHWGGAYIDVLHTSYIGSSSDKVNSIYSNYYMGTQLGFNKNNAFTMAYLTKVVGSNLGDSTNKWTTGYIQTIYGTVSSGSDRRIKKDIVPLDDKFREFYEKLNPVSFVYTDRDDDRTHTGFVAQEVEEALTECGLDKLGLINNDDSGIKHLNYTEFIAIQTKVIQDLNERVKKLENIIREMEK